MGGFLFGYFSAAFCIFIILVQSWAHKAPTVPNNALGQLYKHNEHGWITYFTAFQATSSALMFWSNFVALGLAIAILPKQNVTVRRWGRLTFGASWQNDDEKGFTKLNAAFGVVAAPMITVLLGPMIVIWLNSHGIVLTL